MIALKFLVSYCRNDDDAPTAWCYTFFNETSEEIKDEPCFTDDQCDECLIVQNRQKCEKQGKICFDSDSMVDKGVECVDERPKIETKFMSMFDVNEDGYNGTVVSVLISNLLKGL